MQPRLPTAALLLGLAGLIPFIGCGIAAVALGDAEQTSRGLTALMAYGAVILAFLGGVHWGLVLDAVTPAVNAPRAGPRLVLGIVPSLIGWLALLAPLVAPPEVGLALLIAGFIATILGETQLYRRGLVPRGYMWLRWGLSIVVLTVLVTVLALRLLGAKIVF